jgi:hypothetical protein
MLYPCVCYLVIVDRATLEPQYSGQKGCNENFQIITFAKIACENKKKSTSANGFVKRDQKGESR